MDRAHDRVLGKTVCTSKVDPSHIFLCICCKERAGFRSPEGRDPYFFHYPHRGPDCPLRSEEWRWTDELPPEIQITEDDEQRLAELLKSLRLECPDPWSEWRPDGPELERLCAMVLAASSTDPLWWEHTGPGRLLRELRTVEFAGVLRALIKWLHHEHDVDTASPANLARMIAVGVQERWTTFGRGDSIERPDTLLLRAGASISVGSDERWFSHQGRPVRQIEFEGELTVDFRGPLAARRLWCVSSSQASTASCQNPFLDARKIPFPAGSAFIVHGDALTRRGGCPRLYILPARARASGGREI